MSQGESGGADAVMQSIGRMLEAGRAGIDWVSLARVIAAHRDELAELACDRRAVDAWLDAEADDGPPPRAPEPVALAIELEGVLLARLLRLGLAWQRVFEGCAPRIREALADVQPGAAPPPAVRREAIAQVRLLLDELGAMLRDQAGEFEHDLHRLQDLLLPR